MAETSIAITDADLTNPVHAAAVVDLIDVLATWPENGNPLPEDVRPTLISKLIEYNRCHENLHILLAWEEETAVGLAVCFKGFSTFRGAPLLNIHDFVVRDGFRGRGIGWKMLEAVESKAGDLGCCRLTLEVHHVNHAARKLYEKYGFDAGDDTTAQSFFMKLL